jgi:hypothetical protein
MASLAWVHERNGIWRFSSADALLVALAALHGVILTLWRPAPLVALGMWWNANTIAHNFIHRPFFRSVAMNRAFSAALSIILGIPQTLWRDRHLAHHAGIRWRLRVSWQLATETALVVSLWVTLAILQPRSFLAYLPGYFVGLGLCAMQGHWEHAVGRPVSHYGRLYNFLCFNDGYHAEHHADPRLHWRLLPRFTEADAASSRWPALLRWAEVRPLEALELLVLRSRALQCFVLRKHRCAFRKILPDVPPVHRITIVGGGLFPRTALVLRDLLPSAQITIVDCNPRNLETARAFLGDAVKYRLERFVTSEPLDCDLAVIPLCLEGDRSEIYRRPPAPFVAVHDWIWRPHGIGAVVSTLLLKRINVVRQ